MKIFQNNKTKAHSEFMISLRAHYFPIEILYYDKDLSEITPIDSEFSDWMISVFLLIWKWTIKMKGNNYKCM